jgi:hypothetical protein
MLCGGNRGRLSRRKGLLGLVKLMRKRGFIFGGYKEKRINGGFLHKQKRKKE